MEIRASIESAAATPRRTSERWFVGHLRQTLARTARTGKSLAVISVHFNEITSAGPRLAQDGDVATHVARCSQALRVGTRGPTDAHDIVAWDNGSELLLVIEGAGDSGRDALLIRRLLNQLDPVVTPSSAPHRRLAPCLGVALGQSPTEPERLLQQARSARRRASPPPGPGHAVRFFEEWRNAVFAEFAATEIEIENALRRGELRLHFQPIACARTRAWIGAESLLRWQHPCRGLLPAAEFVALARETGQLIEMGRWGLASACRRVRHWRAAEGTPLRLSVNLSLGELSSERFAELVGGVLAESRLSAEELRFEISEQEVLQDERRALSGLVHLRELGVGIVVEDFGVLHSPIHYLHFPITGLKLDRTIVGRLSDAATARRAREMLSLARRLGLETGAEAVETAEQARFLAEHGCDELQGSFVGEPASSADKAPAAEPAESYAIPSAV